MKKVELLSPAGDLERLKVTLLYGADAVYVGGKSFGLRANATNFTIEELKEGCDFAHKLGKKVYLTLNIVFHDEDLIQVFDYIQEVVEAGIDAFIVSDIAICDYIKKNYDNDACEWIAKVEWIKTVDRENAYYYSGIFVSRNTVCKIDRKKHKETLDFLFEKFGI